MALVSVELVGFRELEATLDSASARMMQKAGSAMLRASRVTRDAVRSHTPVDKRSGSGGATQKSITFRIERGRDLIESEIYSGLDDQAKVRTLEFGRTPGAPGPPPSILMAKYGLSMWDARQFSFNISAKGQEPHLMFQRGFNDVVGDITEFFEIVLDIL
jgi:hypothetical protein